MELYYQIILLGIVRLAFSRPTNAFEDNGAIETEIYEYLRV